MPRMTRDQFKKLNLPGTYDSVADFDAFLQMEEGPEKEAVAKTHGYVRGDSASLKGLRQAVKR